MIGKCPHSGAIPYWSYCIWAAFHAYNWAYTALSHAIKSRHGGGGGGAAVATEVAPNWWIGGRYAASLKMKWALTVDLTCEFPEGCRATSAECVLLPCYSIVSSYDHRNAV